MKIMGVPVRMKQKPKAVAAVGFMRKILEKPVTASIPPRVEKDRRTETIKRK